jgi:hypothetical protein
MEILRWYVMDCIFNKQEISTFVRFDILSGIAHKLKHPTWEVELRLQEDRAWIVIKGVLYAWRY